MGWSRAGDRADTGGVRILGIDPGLRITGFGCIDGRASARAARLVEAGVVRLAGGSSPTRPIAERLVELESDLSELLSRLRPSVVAVERLFSHHRFPATGVAMGHARGVILLLVARSGIPLVEVEPASVKKAVTGSGRATKRQMQLAVQAEFGLAEPPSPADVADALSVALCALRRSSPSEVGPRGAVAPERSIP